MSDKNEVLQEISKVLFEKHMAIREKMCIEEFIRIIDEQIKSGDFMQHVCQADNSFSLTYIPYREVDRLEQELQAAEEENRILREAVEFLRSKLCELVIDDCGYKPENEDREQLIGVVYGSSERCEELLSYIDCELEKIKRGGE